MSGASRAFELALRTPWAITEDYLRTILNVASRETLFPDALRFEEGQALEGSRDTVVRDGVAIIPVVGPIFRRANLFMRFSGGTSTELLALEFGAALRDPDIRAIVLDIDSPGGDANGLSELAETIYRAREEKPVVAFVGDLGASGAYWLASATSSVITTDSGFLGSIGVRTAFLDDRERLEKAGVREIEIVSSQSPRKAPDPATNDGRAEIQRVIDDLAEVFIRAVARNRAVGRETVINDFGRGGILVGQAAVDAGMADAIMTFEEVVVALNDGETETGDGTMAKADDKATERPEITVALIDEQHPQIADHFRAEGHKKGFDEGRETGAAAERERIQAIEELSSPGYEELIAKLKYEPGMTAEQVAVRVVKAQREQRSRQLDGLKRDEAGFNAPDPSVDEGQGDTAQLVKRTLALYGATRGKGQKQLTS